MARRLRSEKGSQLTWSELDANIKEAGYLAADIASASTVDLNTDGNWVNVTGSTTITSFAANAPVGTIRYVRFGAAITVTHHATNLVCPGGRNPVYAQGDVIMAHCYATGQWRITPIWHSGMTIRNVQSVNFWGIYDIGNVTGSATIEGLQARQKMTMTGNVTTVTINAPTGPGAFHVDIYQDGTGSRVITWPSSLKWPANYATADKALSTAAGSRDRLVLDYDGTNYVANLMKGIA